MMTDNLLDTTKKWRKFKDKNLRTTVKISINNSPQRKFI